MLCKNRYVGRTFIQPSTRLRKLGVAKKFGLITENFRDKKVVLIDDSIVRGNTMKPIIQLLKSAGAKEVFYSDLNVLQIWAISLDLSSMHDKKKPVSLCYSFISQ